VVAWLVVAAAGSASLGSTADLRITYWPRGQGTGAVFRWTLRCGPTAGTLPRPVQACRRLAGLRAPFAPLPKGVACAQIYGGPQVAVVSGTFRGRRVWARFSRTDSCRIERWERVRFLFVQAYPLLR
jgi:hypothetical protein